MKPFLQILSWIALVATILPAVLYLGGSIELGTVKTWMLVATVLWFATVPMWMGRKAS